MDCVTAQKARLAGVALLAAAAWLCAADISGQCVGLPLPRRSSRPEDGTLAWGCAGHSDSGHGVINAVFSREAGEGSAAPEPREEPHHRRRVLCRQGRSLPTSAPTPSPRCTRAAAQDVFRQDLWAGAGGHARLPSWGRRCCRSRGRPSGQKCKTRGPRERQARYPVCSW